MRLNVIDVGCSGGIQHVIPHFSKSRRFLPYTVFLDFFGFGPGEDELSRLDSTKTYVKLFNTVVTDKSGFEMLYITRSPECSSLREPDTEIFSKYFLGKNKNWLEITDIRQVPAVTLNEVVQKDNIFVDWLKIDSQGSEYEVLLGSTKALETATVVIVETSTKKVYKDQKVLTDVFDLLARYDFDIAAINYKPRFSIENDIIFIKNLNKVSTFRDFLSITTILSILRMDSAKKYILKNISPHKLSKSDQYALEKLLHSAEQPLLNMSINLIKIYFRRLIAISSARSYKHMRRFSWLIRRAK
jgi:FkbM family methyltransferase